MELSRNQIESFIAAYKESYGEHLDYQEAFEIAHRLVGVFQILQKALIDEESERSEQVESCGSKIVPS